MKAIVKITPIKTEADYEATLAEIDRLMDSEAGSARGDRLDILVTLVEAYEERRWVIEPPDPIDAIVIRMDQRGLTRRDLQNILGSSGRVSEILNRKRPLSIEMMRRVHKELDIPAASFLRAPRRQKSKRPRSRAA